VKKTKRDKRKADLLHSLGHPLRREILLVLAEKKRPLAPRDIAEKELPDPLSNVAYHMRVLSDKKAVKLVRTEPVRGSSAHLYRFNIRAPWALDALGLGRDLIGSGRAARLPQPKQ
jgi:DNA-binding transcriptional ArsR family regulator